VAVNSCRQAITRKFGFRNSAPHHRYKSRRNCPWFNCASASLCIFICQVAAMRRTSPVWAAQISACTFCQFPLTSSDSQNSFCRIFVFSIAISTLITMHSISPRAAECSRSGKSYTDCNLWASFQNLQKKQSYWIRRCLSSRFSGGWSTDEGHRLRGQMPKSPWWFSFHRLRDETVSGVCSSPFCWRTILSASVCSTVPRK
jgi:hypothetical protein